MKSILEIESLKKYYGRSKTQTKALDGITFQVMPGEFLGIMGSSGSGKSTLLNCIATVISPDSGSIAMNGRQVQALKGAALAAYRGKKIGYLFQNFEMLDNLTGRENSVRALLAGILSYRAESDLPEMMIVSAVMVLALCLVECIYIAVVKRSSDRYLLTLMVPERKE